MLVPEPTLDSLMQGIGGEYLFTQERYPNADLSTPEKIRSFAVHHSALHMAKTAAKVAAEAEKYDHGGEMDELVLQKAAAKGLINALKLAQELGMDARAICFEVARAVNGIE